MKRTLALLWSLGVLAACSIPGNDLPDVRLLPFSQDKWIHVALFVGVGWLWLRAFPDRLWTILLGGVAFGIGIEVWQTLLPIGRSAELLDVVADVIGLVLGLWLGVWAQRREADVAA